MLNPVRFEPQDRHVPCIMHERENLSNLLFDEVDNWKKKKGENDDISSVIYSFEETRKSSGFLKRSTTVTPAIKCVACLYEAIQKVSTTYDCAFELNKKTLTDGSHSSTRYEIKIIFDG